MKSTKNISMNRVILVCAYCKKVLKGENLWEHEAMRSDSSLNVSHGICPDCLLEHFPREYLAIQEERRVRIKNAFKKGFAELYGHIAK